MQKSPWIIQIDIWDAKIASKFKATNPSNKLEDVNTIKQFCDAVNANLGGEAAVVASRLLAHKIQSPQGG